MPLTTKLSVTLDAVQTGAPVSPDNGTVVPATHTLLIQKVLELINGTGVGAADVLYQDTNTLAASANTDIDLSGALSNSVGGTSVFARVKGLLVMADAGNTNNVVVGAAASNPWATMLNSTGTLQVRPGGFQFGGCTDATGWAVTAGTGDLLRIANGAAGTQVIYTIAVIGCSA